MPSPSATKRCRDLLARCRPEWVSGRGHEAWSSLSRARSLERAAPWLPVEVLAVEAGLHVLAEQAPQARKTATECLKRADTLRRVPHATRIAIGDARVTLASLRTWGEGMTRDDDASGDLVVLDEIARDPTLARTRTATRAVNNALIIRTNLLRSTLHSTRGQVAAWMAVSEARAVTRGWPDQGALLRQAVGLAFQTGQWERGWDHAQQQIAAESDRNERIAVLAHAALLAWHRGMLRETRDLGGRAVQASVAVDHPWVRTYAYLGGVLQAAAGGGSIEAALRAYVRCTSRAGHATRPFRAWAAAQVAMEAGVGPAEIERFMTEVLPTGMNAGEARALMRLQLADARGARLDDADLAAASTVPDVPDAVRVCLVRARWLRANRRHTAAAASLADARFMLRDWPGRLLEQVEHELSLTAPAIAVSAAQRRVLDLVADGLSNADIAARLRCSERTVAVHITTMLRTNALTSRTQLASRHLRSQLLGVGH